jgi:hypothetical protein
MIFLLCSTLFLPSLASWFCWIHSSTRLFHMGVEFFLFVLWLSFMGIQIYGHFQWKVWGMTDHGYIYAWHSLPFSYAIQSSESSWHPTTSIQTTFVVVKEDSPWYLVYTLGGNVYLICEKLETCWPSSNLRQAIYICGWMPLFWPSFIFIVNYISQPWMTCIWVACKIMLLPCSIHEF